MLDWPLKAVQLTIKLQIDFRQAFHSR